MFRSDWVDWLLGSVLAIIALGTLVVLVWGIVDDYRSEKFSLRKDEWRCAASREESTTILQPTLIGSQTHMMPQTIFSTVCDRWERVR